MIRPAMTSLLARRTVAAIGASAGPSARRLAAASYATVTANSPTQTQGSGAGAVSLPPLGSIEAAWNNMPPQQQEAVFHHLEGLQKKDWKELSLDEKKASYFVSFGPHGPRAPLHPPGSTPKLLVGIAAALAASAAVFATIRSLSPDPPRTMTREWQEASMERAKEQKMDPFTGPASDHPKARTLVQSK